MPSNTTSTVSVPKRHRNEELGKTYENVEK